jgi:CheY-like chemotaxis protein
LRDLNDTLERRVDERTARLRALAVELGQAEERERRRLARLLHDHFQQILVSARFQLGRLSASPSTVASADIERVAAAIDEAIRASRDLTAELIPPSLYDMGLPTALYGLTQMMAERHHLSVQVQLAPQADVGDTAMRAFLYQAARELLFNVVKHARVDRASLSLTAQESRIELTVEDAGAGFDLTDAAGDHKSFGLLNIRERAEYLGGRLEIAAAPGRGTRATLWVPVGQTVEPRHPRPTGMPGGHSQQIDIVHESAARPGAIRVVIADDHQMVRQGLVVMLNDEDDVTIVGQAANGQEALDVVRRIHPDVVLMDVTMPVMDGTEATLAIKREMPDVQVIGLSMHTDAHMASRMREAGAAGYIIKSGQIDELVDTIRRAIDDRRPRHPAMSPGGV